MTLLLPYRTDLLRGFEAVHIGGLNTAVTNGGIPEDIWTQGGVYAFPSAAATTTVVGGAQDVNTTGTGAWTVRVTGLDSDYLTVVQDVEMDGATPVTLTTDLLRVNCVRVLTAGTDETNNGVIQVKHGATVLRSIPASSGICRDAIYTIPDDYTYGLVTYWDITLSYASVPQTTLQFQVRPNGGAWYCARHYEWAGYSQFPYEPVSPFRLETKTDIRVRCTRITQDTRINSNFEVLQVR